VAAIIVRLDGRTCELDDMVQDVFVDAASGMSRLRAPNAIKGWIAKITVRVVQRRWRTRKLWRLFGFDRPSDGGELVDGAASPADRLLLRAVYRILDDMPGPDRLAFCLHIIEGETIPMTATLCGCSSATAKRRILRAQCRIEEGLPDV